MINGELIVDNFAGDCGIYQIMENKHKHHGDNQFIKYMSGIVVH